MSENVEFDMDKRPEKTGWRNPGEAGTYAAFGQSQTPGMAGWLVRKGYIKTEAAAKNVLLCVVVGDFVIAGLVIYFFILN